MLHRQKENNGIVQKFEEPTSPYNTLIRAYWTPHKLTLQQRVNKQQLSNTAVVMNERLATFDGPEHLNVEFDIKSYKLKMRLEEYVSSIVNHVRKLLPSAYTLWTMECYFKLSGKNKLLFLWCNDLRVFNTNDPPKIEAFLAPPINASVASKHKYEKKDLKKEYFRCPCAEFKIDPTCAKVGGLFDVSQMKITTYRYMILYHQSQAPIEKEVLIPEDDEYSKLSPYRKRWIEEDEMIKFKENQEVKAYELRNGSLVYQMQKNRDYMRELNGWEQIPPLPVSNADPLVFKFLSKLAISDGKVILAHNLNDYSKQDLADFRRWFHNVVTGPQKGSFLDKKMKVCDGCCIKFNSSADDNMSLEMTKLVVGPPGESPSATKRSRAGRTSRTGFGDTGGSKMSSLMASPQMVKTVRSDVLPKIGGKDKTARRSQTSLGFSRPDHGSGMERERQSSLSPNSDKREIGEGGERSKDSIGGVSKESSVMSLDKPVAATFKHQVPAKNVREWIQFFYQEAELRANTPALSKSKTAKSPYQKALPFLG